MKSILSLASLGVLLFLVACGASKTSVLPLSTSPMGDDNYTLIWNGTSKAYRYEQGQWVRDESYDYRFDVVQCRYDKHWQSVKSLHRLHPEYDGKAGDRDQSMYFEVHYKASDGVVSSSIRSTLGEGTGSSDVEFRKALLQLNMKNASAFLPYNTFRISQHYNYEEGILQETVELFLAKDGKEIPFMKNEETAYLFTKSKLDQAPTRFAP